MSRTRLSAPDLSVVESHAIAKAVHPRLLDQVRLLSVLPST